MTGLALRRLGQVLPLLLGMSILVFVVMRLAPGNPVLAMYGGQPGVTPEVEEAARHRMGLDEPLPVQYAKWLNGLVHGDLGQSYVNHSSVVSLLVQKLPASLELAIGGLVLAVLIGFPLGVLAATHRGRAVDTAISGFAAAGIAVPGYWLGIMLVLLFSVQLGWLPSNGYVPLSHDPTASLEYALLPSLTIAIGLAAPIIRYIRSSMLDALSEQYIRTARAMGVPERSVIYRHALKNAIPPTITILGLQFGTLMGGVIVVEWVFAWPGIGQLLISAITGRDYAVVQGAILLTILIFTMTSAVVDILYAWVDPRTRTLG